ncbi:DarT ssDNA thymidine ADP-ribosyltransferase family protein [Sulfurovum sp.]|uniref:DarT ssDNA thymidine ADP-ribosyltransferase family protein n=1 Tax=Sulfurovum sp. TaxID=1969726 RepID=UPI0018572359|nr:DarT ssDNA thymidine ADP-ribosyltransferase family protein [Sulfurovum sp.]HFU77380.1 DUF4433 domain-containing protein [Campylobacterota bacterium]
MNRQVYVEAFQAQLASKFNVGYQSWWHKFLFHYSDISNVISILNSGQLYSRNKALELGLMQNDNADDDVIGNTGVSAKDYVRFYFGALTPTQYHNEGFKSGNNIQHNAHCPVPVFLLFDFVKLLAREDSKFSSGNIASSGVDIYSKLEDLNQLEFEYIYHRGSTFQASNSSHITYCRHAEVLIPNALNIYDYLEYVVVRSEAEKQTLLYHLDSDTKQKLEEKIRIRTNGLFYADRLYIENIRLDDNMFRISFSKATNDKFDFVFTITNYDTHQSYKKEVEQVSLESKSASFKIKPEFVSKNISLKITIDGSLAYEHNFGDDSTYIL